MSEYINRLHEARLSARVVRDPGGRRNLLVMWRRNRDRKIQACAAAIVRGRRAGAFLLAGRFAAGSIVRVHATALPGLFKRDAAVLGNAEDHLIGQGKARNEIDGQRHQRGNLTRSAA